MVAPLGTAVSETFYNGLLSNSSAPLPLLCSHSVVLLIVEGVTTSVPLQSSIRNEPEAAEALLAARSLKGKGCRDRDMVILTPYSAQAEFLERRRSPVRVSTVDVSKFRCPHGLGLN